MEGKRLRDLGPDYGPSCPPATVCSAATPSSLDCGSAFVTRILLVARQPIDLVAL